MKRLASLAVIFTAAATAVAFAATETWSVDTVHSFAQFTARHFGIVPVVGTIPIKSATVQVKPGSEIPTFVRGTLDATGVDTHNGMRDNDIRSGHYLEADKYPNIEFTSTKITGNDPKHFTIAGDLTIHGQSHPVTLNAQIVASGTTPRGKSVIAYSATTTIERSQWGITYGPIIVSNNVDISLNIEADKP